MATPPYITVNFDPPSASDTNSDFDAKASDTMGKLNPWGGEANDLADWIGVKADQALAAATGGDLPNITGKAGEFLRVKADESGAEFFDIPTPVTANWEAGSMSVESLVSPAKVKAAIDAFEQQIGVGQTWQDVTASRSHSTSYQNTTGKPIVVNLSLQDTGPIDLEVSADNTTWVVVGRSSGSSFESVSFIVPNNNYYRANGSVTVDNWSELR